MTTQEELIEDFEFSSTFNDDPDEFRQKLSLSYETFEHMINNCDLKTNFSNDTSLFRKYLKEKY